MKRPYAARRSQRSYAANQSGAGARVVPQCLKGDVEVAKFLLKSTYTLDGVKGLAKDGGSKRAEIATKAIEAAGGRVESLCFGLGEHDTYVVCDLPDHKTAAALAIAIRAAGGVDTRVVPLLTPQEVDEAVQKQMSYQPPGA